MGDHRRRRRRWRLALDLRVDWLALSQVRRLQAAQGNGRHRKRNSGHARQTPELRRSAAHSVGKDWRHFPLYLDGDVKQDRGIDI